MKNKLFFALMLVLALTACGAANLPEVKPDPNVPDTTPTVSGDTTAAWLYIGFAGARNDTLEVLASEPEMSFAVHANRGLQTVSAFAMLGSEAKAIGSAITAFDNDTLYERKLTAADVNVYNATGLRVQATDKAGKSLRATVALALNTSPSVPDDTTTTDTSQAALAITFLRSEAAVYGSVNPIIRLKVDALAGLKKISYYYYAAPEDMPEILGTVGDLNSATSYTGEVMGLTPSKFNRNAALVEVVAEDMEGATVRRSISIARRGAIDDAELCAFPGAEGFGKYATGGRGGAVLYVTNLNDAGSGSLRAAVEAAGARTVLFKVSGTIHLQKRLAIKNGNITIAGQTAPGDGICLAGYDVTVEDNNVVLRYLRFRMGAANGVESDAIWGRGHSNIILDHCSMSWSTDECVSFYEVKDFSLQWCLLSESLKNSLHEKGAHGYGGIWGGQNTSFHHNLLAHHDSRNPRFASGEVCLSCADPSIGKLSPVDFRNNVVYNWGQTNSAYGGEATDINFVNNYYKPGPATKSSIRERLYAPGAKTEDDGSGRFVNIINVWGGLFVEGNYVAGSANATADNWAYGIQGIDAARKAQIKRTTPFTSAPITQHSAEIAYERVLTHAGASLNRDAVDLRVVGEARNGTYTYSGSNGSTNGIIDNQQDVGGWPMLASLAAPLDTDNDGMPDVWELANNLNPTSAADRNSTTLSSCYTNLEVYLAWLVEHITKAQYSE
ncbi:MAG: hypothetical protein LBS63_05310 [Prevotellaceae bacterium]|nr:hypothetical protein [Prevotellaceae bacterium]